MTRVLPPDAVIDELIRQQLSNKEILARCGGGSMKTIADRRKVLGILKGGKPGVKELLRQGVTRKQLLALGYSRGAVDNATKAIQPEPAAATPTPVVQVGLLQLRPNPLEEDRRRGLTLPPLKPPTRAQLMAGR